LSRFVQSHSSLLSPGGIWSRLNGLIGRILDDVCENIESSYRSGIGIAIKMYENICKVMLVVHININEKYVKDKRSS
jgi:hypothetical protein